MIELMVVLGLVAILGTLAAPSFVSLIEINRLQTKANSFLNDLQFARSEAIKQGLPVYICPTADNAVCSGANNWATGWLVYVDADSSGTLDSGEQITRIRSAWSDQDTFVANAPAAGATLPLQIGYSRDGLALLSGSSALLSLRTASANANAMRCIAIEPAGRAAVVVGGTGSCT
ncbi:Type IV fimbrial biogenesis protein FimT [Burkholderiales bacterium 8X]|nr:Type IV fimbrial biogenesis protein FimT [Burkholderiales bacterium 8X]